MISNNRYLSPQKWDLLLKALPYKLSNTIIGHSVLNQPIYAHQFGNGPIKVLLWSQMHGNESTTTRSLLGLFEHLSSKRGVRLVEGLSLIIIPQLNPDGSSAYSRLNANKIDLNRDAVDLTQPESVALRKVFDSFAPDFCFNLHGQRSIFAAGKGGKSATLSFLSPAANKQRSHTPARVKAMQIIALIHKNLQRHIPGQIGRYDDTFNPNCVGDYFTSLGVPTLLYEAGHNGLDYDRDFSKEMILNALILALNIINDESYLNHSTSAYEQIPKNEKEYVDIIIKNVDVKTKTGLFKNQELAVLYHEEKIGEKVFFRPIYHSFSEKTGLLGHLVLDAEEILKVSEVEFLEGKTIDIFQKTHFK